MTITRLGWLLFWFACSPHLGGATIDPASLAAQVRAFVEEPRFARSSWGIYVVSLESGQVWIDYNGNKLMKPASNAKLFTAALALDRLGADYRFKTSLYHDGKLTAAGVLQGNLVVYGRGDPSFASRFRTNSPSLAGSSLEVIVTALKEAGVRRIEGDLIGDESFFRGPPWGRGWTWDDLEFSYGAPVSALTVDDNIVDLEIRPGERVGATGLIETNPADSDIVLSNRLVTVEAGSKPQVTVSRPNGGPVVYVSGQVPLSVASRHESVTVQNPGRSFLLQLRQALIQGGIKVRGESRLVGWRQRENRPIEVEHWTELSEINGCPLAELLPHMLKPSQNLYAQLMWLAVGAWRQQKEPALALATTEEACLSEMSKFASELGVAGDEMFLEEGSGLSRGALVSPHAIVALLAHMDRHRSGELFKASLPVAGQDGTLSGRFRDTAAQGRLRAKTGTLRFVHTLSGYTSAGNGERLAFSILLNNHPPSSQPSGRQEVDAVALVLCTAGAEDRRVEP